MSKNAGLVLTVICVAAVSAAGLFWRRSEALAAQNKALTEEKAVLEKALDEAEAKGQAALKNSGAGLEAQKRELMQLRNDVGQLRGHEQTVVKVQAENTRLTEENNRLKQEIASKNAQAQELMRANQVADMNRAHQAQMFAQQQQAAAAAAAAGQQPGGAVQPQGSDPLAFYRQNPELMKRYFPHLATNAPGAPQPAPPQQQAQPR